MHRCSPAGEQLLYAHTVSEPSLVSDFKLRPLHRQRTRRTPTRRVLDQTELAAHFGVEPGEVRCALEAVGWDYHEDAAGRIWASVPKALLESGDR